MEHHASGFTLLELLVVLAIMGLMVSIAMPFTVHSIENMALRTDAREAVTGLRQLRYRALKRREVVIVRSLVARTESGMAHNVNGNALIQTRDDEKAPTFYPDGTSTDGVVRLREGNKTLDVHIAWLTGKITAGKPQ